jgi:hypothetical protein
MRGVLQLFDEMIKQTAIFANGQDATCLLHGGLIKML